jgi:hypothetical protein
VRSGQRANSQNAVGISASNENLKQAQKQAGLAGLSDLYGSQQSEQLGALGQGNNATNAGTEAGKSGWYQNFLGTLAALKPTGSAGGGQPASFGIGG